MSREEITVEEFHARLKAQGVDREDLAFVCPMCRTVQSARDLIVAGGGSNFDEVEGRLAFSCIGRLTGAGAPRKKPDGNPCNWTLGGLLQCQELTVVTPDGAKHPRFAPVTPEEAIAHRDSQKVAA